MMGKGRLCNTQPLQNLAGTQFSPCQILNNMQPVHITECLTYKHYMFLFYFLRLLSLRYIDIHLYIEYTTHR